MVDKKFLWRFVIISLSIVILDQILKYLFLKFNFDLDLDSVSFRKKLNSFLFYFYSWSVKY